MTIDTSNLITVTEANQNFSRAMKKADQKGQVVIFKRNRPKYMLINLDESPIIEMTDDEKIDFVAARILKKYHAAFEELAK
ncbi:MAG: type II toxin-antitoxin system Phd/YefM family antitoxin [Spirochaetales bacterium]|nr:type II toxin-antitoxin system Phd/YefM family antitoxin [Spirochaetales bacterium]